ncbi:hypothetical protein IEQ34_007217 [Dendrobium chrysotoxum]|uniref:Uncharacterized protein n=1 Tax=Dendrobium chrysotoxum TaxID=161865 RepID=A0AAV7H5Q2_DENCH|nr:hypothetical protein IEQ34_007217 [Dendrobium chrysotoxum]
MQITSDDDPPCRSFTSKFSQKKLSVGGPSRPRQPNESEGRSSVPPVIPSPPLPPPPPPPPLPRSQQKSPSEQGQGQLDPTVPEHSGPSTPAAVGVGDPAAVADKHLYIEPEGNIFNPSRPPTHKIRDILKRKYDAPYLSWKKILKKIRDIWFRKFQKYFRWLPEDSMRIKINFERRGSTHLTDMFTDIRNFGQHPSWIGEGVWADLSRAWASPEFIKLREQNKQNRASDYGGLGSSFHTDGSVPHTEHKR